MPAATSNFTKEIKMKRMQRVKITVYGTDGKEYPIISNVDNEINDLILDIEAGRFQKNDLLKLSGNGETFYFNHRNIVAIGIKELPAEGR